MRALVFFLMLISFYGQAHEFRSFSKDRCLDLSYGSVKNGNSIIMYTCHEGDNQRFIYENENIKLAKNKNYCVDISLGYEFNLGDVILWQCNGGDNQKFIINNMSEIKSKDGKCLQYNDNGDLSLGHCDGSDAQKYSIPSYCLYPQANYRGNAYCSSNSKDSFIHPNYPVSSVSIAGGYAILYENINFDGMKKIVYSNTDYVGDDFNHLAKSIIFNKEENKTFLITSDPQLTCGINCSLSNEQSRDNVFSQYRMFSKNYPHVDAVIINGDLTEFGHNREWKDFESAISKLNVPYYYGLGNHDIFNNFNDCWENNCTIRSFLKLYDHVKSKNNLLSFDVVYSHGYQFPEILTTLEGSFSYSIDFGDIIMIQMNDFLHDVNPLLINQYLSGALGNGFQRYKISRYQDAEYNWLENQLYNARKENKIIIFNQHRKNADAGNLYHILDKYDIKLKFSGHYHYNLGKSSTGFYESGSSARGDYLKLDIDVGNRVAKIYKSSGVNSVSLDLIDEVSLNIDNNIIHPPKPLPATVKVKNNGGYESYVWVSYDDINGNEVRKSSGKLLLGNVFKLDIPGGSKNLRVRSANNTGLVWEPQRNIFSEYRELATDFCVKTWGTTLNSKWGYTSCN
ncbi:ricin-type beta-trefoil lectin domain protein [Vibrio alginolyticus]|uniref:ricin-type beta-trefoil lectin domain protein n=1 Tax=Vibrio alginolyticus TaxID=663 RepID=UPI00215D0D0F|nr:ricin-type beta-trefoil lectin domain protein [Vibrio alginolyticus]MCS0038326.1 ricin-type beta-trefoil lectin domain protein [Vibrio alginolyticus]